MKIIKTLFFIICISILNSCNHENIKVNTELKSLKENININFNPISVKWVYSDIGNERFIGPIDHEIMVVLKLTNSDRKKIYKECVNNGSINVDFLSPNFLKNWFPKSLKNCFNNNGSAISINKKVFSISSFQKSPFLNGFCFFTDNNELFIYLYTT